MAEPAWPGLMDPMVKERIRGHLIQSGRWQQLASEVDPRKPIPFLTRSLFRDYKRTGTRTRYEKEHRIRTHALNTAVLMLWLDHPQAELDYVQDLMWAACEMSTWILPAHEFTTIDLTASATARYLSEYSFILSDRLETEVRERIHAELERRILVPATDPARMDYWHTVDNNWNHVCNANLIATALYEIKDARRLAAFIHPIVMRLGYAIDGFTNDGGCVEGPGYWDYGFSHFVDAAIMLQHRTGGAINLMTADPKIERICRYPLATYLSAPKRLAFSDADDDFIAASTALKINRFFRLPRLYDYTQRTEDRTMLYIKDLRGMSIYAGEQPQDRPEEDDFILPDLGMAKACAADKSSEVILGVTAGDNGVSHNHNDLGSFVVYRKGAVLLTDPGAPLYTAKTFGPHRYDILLCRSRGHSVPVINGLEQSAGATFRATLTTENFGVPGAIKKITADLTRAYSDPTLASLVRRWELAPNGNLAMTDTYIFREQPESLEEAFITFANANVLENGDAVQLSEGTVTATLRSDGEGKFDIQTFSAGEYEGRGSASLHRIRFTPKTLLREMTLSFSLK
ncbi:MAG: heparinase II/III family protein [Candidatus Methylacidiphilales bacterium]